MFSTKQETSKGWSYSWESWAKAGLLLAGVPACYYALKTTGLGFISNWFSNSKSANDGSVTLFQEDQDVHFSMPETGQAFSHIQSRKLLEHTEFDEPLTRARIKRSDNPPVLGNNTLEVEMGQTLVLDNSHLSATDIDDSDAALNFTISDEQHCQFEETVNPGIAITNFIQQQITNSEIQFVHDNSTVAPAYSVSVSDGVSGTEPEFATVNFYSDTYVMYGTEFHINTYTTDVQCCPSVTGLSDGKFVVTWLSRLQDGSEGGVYCQMYNANGTVYGSEFRVNTYTTSGQGYPSVTGLSDGKFVVAWQSDGQDGSVLGVYGQIYNANGIEYGGEFQVNTYTGDIQNAPSVTGLSDGKFVVTWRSRGQDGDWDGIYGQMYNANGTEYGSEFQVNTYTASFQEWSSVAGLNDGKFIVTWHSYGSQDGSGYGVYGQMYTANGTEYGSEFRVNTYTTSYQYCPSVAGLSDGKFVVTWSGLEQDGDLYGIYGQIYHANGTEYDSEFRVNTYITHSQEYPSVAGLSDGRFVVTWTSYGQDGDRYNLYGQIYNANGTEYGSEFRVNTYTYIDQEYPSVAGLSDGKFVVTWDSFGQDGSFQSVYGQMYEPGRNYAPQLVDYVFIITQGETIVITNAMISATDANDVAGILSFDLGNVQSGNFEVETRPDVWETATSFSQQQVIDNEVRFVHDWSDNAPSFDITVRDHQLSSSPIFANVTVVLLPSLSESRSESLSASRSKSPSLSTSESLSESTSESLSELTSASLSASTSASLSEPISESLSESTSASLSDPLSASLSEPTSESLSLSTSRSLSESTSTSLNEPTSESTSESVSPSLSEPISESLSESTSASFSNPASVSLSESTSVSPSLSTSESLSESTSTSLSEPRSASLSTSASKTDTTTGTTTTLSLSEVINPTSDLGSSEEATPSLPQTTLTTVLNSSQSSSTGIGSSSSTPTTQPRSSHSNSLSAVINSSSTMLTPTTSNSTTTTKVTDSNSSEEKIGFPIWYIVLPLALIGGCGLTALTGAVVFYKCKKNKRDSRDIELQDVKVEETEDTLDVMIGEVSVEKTEEGPEAGPDEYNAEKIEESPSRKSRAFSVKLGGIKQPKNVLPFRKIRQIGVGAHATVYEGKYIEGRKKTHVAVKQLHEKFFDEDDVTRELTNEAYFLREHKHKNLVELVCFVPAPHWCIALKYYHRGSLANVLRDKEYVLPWNPERNDFMTGIAEGLRFLHSKGIIHRDMKPDNVLIDENMQPKITDLGTARILDTLTLTKGVGTPTYIAPEVVKPIDGKIHYDSSADVFAFGLILWVIWTREEPFQHFKIPWQIMNYIVDQQGRPPIEDCPSPSLANLMSRCWAHRAEERPKMPEVCEELRKITAESALPNSYSESKSIEIIAIGSCDSSESKDMSFQV